jgi:hypothetical protein
LVVDGRTKDVTASIAGSRDVAEYRAAIDAALAAAGHVEPARGQSSQSLDWSADDAARITYLTSQGVRLEGRTIIVWLPPDSLPVAQRQRFVDDLDRGVAALRVFVGSHSWQRFTDQKITYYVSPERFVSHATGQAAVFIPIARVTDGRAPYLHEAAHELLAARAPFYPHEHPDPDVARRFAEAFPLWLFEGLADYVAQAVAAKTGFKEGDVFGIGGLAFADGTCAKRLAEPRGEEILRYIGGPGAPEALFTADRQTIAPTFYACAQSFIKFLVERVDVQSIVGLVPLVPQDRVEEGLMRVTKSPVPSLRAEWLRSIGYSDQKEK